MFSVFKKLNWFIKKNTKAFIIFLIADIVAGIISIFLPKIVGYLVNLLYSSSLNINSFLYVILFIIFLTLVGYVSSALFIYILFKLSLIFEVTYRDNFYRHVMRMSANFFEKYSVGDLITRITSDLRQVAIATGEGLFFIVEGTIFFTIVIIGMLTSSNLKLTFYTVIPSIILIFILTKIGKLILKYSDIAQKELSDLSDSILETSIGMPVIRSYVKEELIINKLIKQVNIGKEKFKNVDKYENIIVILVWSVFGITEIIAIFLGSNMVFDGIISTGDLVTFILYLGLLAWPVIAWSSVTGILKRGESSYDRLNIILEEEEEIKLTKDHKKVDKFESIKFNNFNFKFPNKDDYVLKNITFEIKKGMTIGIIGKVGSGKSTLIKQLLRNYPLFKKNSITLNNISYDEYNVDKLRELFGYVPQENIIFSKSIKENLQLAKNNATDYEILNALRLADFEKDLNKFSHGIHTSAGENGSLLSGGQKQRIAIARAFLNDPEILILDDSLSSVDAVTEAKIISNILKYRKNKTNIIITNRVSELITANSILILEKGKIVAQGTHEELLKNSKWYLNEYNYQSGKFISEE